MLKHTAMTGDYDTDTNKLWIEIGFGRIAIQTQETLLRKYEKKIQELEEQLAKKNGDKDI